MSVHPAWVGQLSPDVRKWARDRRKTLNAYAPTPNLKPVRPRHETLEKWTERILKKFSDEKMYVEARVEGHYLAATTGFVAVITADRPEETSTTGIDRDFSFLTSRRKNPGAEYTTNPDFHLAVRRAAIIPGRTDTKPPMSVISLTPRRDSILVTGKQYEEVYQESVPAEADWRRKPPPTVYLNALFLEPLMGVWPLTLRFPYKHSEGTPVVIGRKEDSTRAVIACCDPAEAQKYTGEVWT